MKDYDKENAIPTKLADYSEEELLEILEHKPEVDPVRIQDSLRMIQRTIRDYYDDKVDADTALDTIDRELALYNYGAYENYRVEHHLKARKQNAVHSVHKMENNNGHKTPFVDWDGNWEGNKLER